MNLSDRRRRLLRTALVLLLAVVVLGCALSWARSAADPTPHGAAAPTPGTAAGATTASPRSAGPSGASGAEATETPSGAPTSPATPAAARRVDCSKVPCVALTFDDGPGASTREVLDALTARGARATFFVVGTQVRSHPELVRAEHEAGMEIGNHTWDHTPLSGRSRGFVAGELDPVDAEVRKLTGVTPTFVRPPEGALSMAQRRSLPRPLAYWSVDTLDWRTRSTATTERVASAAKPGDIVLMHDIHPTTAAAVPAIVDALQAKGYTLVTLSTLIGHRPHLHVGYGWGQTPSTRPGR